MSETVKIDQRLKRAPSGPCSPPAAKRQMLAESATHYIVSTSDLVCTAPTLHTTLLRIIFAEQ